MKIGIVGIGGVGGYFGGMIARAGHDVTFVARGKTLKVLREDGLKVKSILGDFELRDIQTADSQNIPSDFDLIMLGVKSWQVKALATSLVGKLKPDSIVLPLQNGVMAYDELVSIVGESRVLGGLSRIISMIEKPGVISHIGAKPNITFGEMNGTLSSRAEKIKRIFDQSGFHSILSQDIKSEIWKKFMMICSGALFALTRSTYKELAEIQESRKMLIDLVTEVHTLSKLEGANIPQDYIKQITDYILTLPDQNTFSLARDIWEGKPSELFYQNGSVVELAKKHGLSVPVNEFVFHTLLPAELKARR